MISRPAALSAARRLRQFRLTSVPKQFAKRQRRRIFDSEDKRSCRSLDSHPSTTTSSLSSSSSSFSGFEVVFLGTGAGAPSMDRNATSICLQLHGRNWLFDCGEGSMKQLLQSTIRLPTTDRIFITHLHGDHIFGLPGMLCSLDAAMGNSSSSSTNDKNFHHHHQYHPDGLSDTTTMTRHRREISIYGPVGLFHFVNMSLQSARAQMSNVIVKVHELVLPGEDQLSHPPHHHPPPHSHSPPPPLDEQQCKTERSLSVPAMDWIHEVGRIYGSRYIYVYMYDVTCPHSIY
jgi:hypothetical protein